MSLLEDIYLEENDDGNDLERIIEGEDIRDSGRSDESDDGGNKSDEAEEEKVRVDPKQPKEKRVARNPRFVLNPARLTGPRGIQTISDHFKDFKFKGKGHEQEDLDVVLKKLEHWAHRLYPKFQFDDCLEKIEVLGRKRPVVTHLKKIRQDMLDLDVPIAQHDSSEDEATVPAEAAPLDEFDRLLEQQIAIARSTPASVRPGSKAEQTPASYRDAGDSTPRHRVDNTFAFTPTISTPITSKITSINKPNSSGGLTEEQKERILRNQRLAEQKRQERLKLQQQGTNEKVLQKNSDTLTNLEVEQTNENNEDIPKNVNKTSDENNCLPTNRDINLENSDNSKCIEDSFGQYTASISNEKDNARVENKELSDKEISLSKERDDAIETEDFTDGKDIELSSDEEEEDIGDEINVGNGKDIESTYKQDKNTGEEMQNKSEKFIDSESLKSLKERDDSSMEVEKDENGKDIESPSNRDKEDFIKFKNKTSKELGEEELMSMSLEYHDENSMNAS